MIIKEWRCVDCDTYFESSDPEPCCPYCTAEEPERAFLTAPSIRSGATTAKDHLVKGLAADYGLSDISNKHGEAVRKAPTGGPAPVFSGPETVQNLRIPANARDQLSPVLPQIQAMGNPRQWARKQGK